ncbi:RNA polymerase sigma-70 factor [Rhodothermus bifroesti]|uniref:RNA polymerase sigma-70 factor n=1 Tax=Rhodothermus marinus TaxID=29549 RepID=A0A7V2B078_RHOMR|nr:RNA polymerase sigma-70 factor [Rhodothermus bifroesti]GBD02076.1 ECF RNA polymerase sigma factor SigW [bacterium HR18]
MSVEALSIKSSLSLLSAREREWIRRIRQGDGEAYACMFRCYYSALCRFALSMLDEEEAAHEVVQEVFLRIWERRHLWQPTYSLRLYLYQAVRNEALNYRRRRALIQRYQVSWEAVPLATEPTAPTVPDEALQAQEFYQALQQAIASLPERRRLTFLLHREHGFTYAEIAKIMGVSPKTVSNQLAEAVKFLRIQLARFQVQ